ncbi:hypothetical protein Ahy_A07g032327 [Arachis hypogaea]|uniref:DJ-1/PfpI domain-containing protein n=1 Tax=Arachis hypogaea TaxID=3818 RepID=A0A445C6S4_ARAHY|nr:hypothetical protein Ahy_A07g032327 [Arachis hypogaea]
MGGTITATAKRILLLCGDYMEDYEVMVPFEALRALGCHVDAVCPKKKSGDTCPTAIHDFEGYQHFTEKPGHDFVLNATFGDVDASGYDALVIPGGRAAEYLALNETIISWVKHFVESNKPIAAISYGQQILVAANVLKGRKVTAYPAMKLNMVLAGATWIEPNPITLCITDGNLITGASWLSHPHFISHLMALLVCNGIYNNKVFLHVSQISLSSSAISGWIAVDIIVVTKVVRLIYFLSLKLNTVSNVTQALLC